MREYILSLTVTFSGDNNGKGLAAMTDAVKIHWDHLVITRIELSDCFLGRSISLPNFKYTLVKFLAPGSVFSFSVLELFVHKNVTICLKIDLVSHLACVEELFKYIKESLHCTKWLAKSNFGYPWLHSLQGQFTVCCQVTSRPWNWFSSY